MKVLLVHERYREPGGEDRVFEAEAATLEAHGHRVTRLEDDNARIDELPRSRLALDTVWSRAGRRRLRDAVHEANPDVVHFHNTFPLLSPAVYGAVRDAGPAVVQTLHNFRPICPSAQLFRDGRPCRDCVGRAVPWPGVLHACYRDDRAASAVVATMIATHGALGTWREGPDVWIALTPFSRDRFVEGGFPPERIVVKPNFVESDPGVGEGPGAHVAYVGRLTEEKGIGVLLAAWEALDDDVPLRIAGDGPLRERVERAAAADPRIEWTGWLDRESVLGLVRESRFVVFPSIWYETFGLGIVEAFASGRPAIASDRGAMADLVEEGRTGRRVAPGDAAALAAAVAEAWSDPDATAAMGREARAEYERRYTAERGHAALIETYGIALERAEGRRG